MFLSVTYRVLLNRNEKCCKIESRISDIIRKLLETLEEYEILHSLQSSLLRMNGVIQDSRLLCVSLLESILL